MDLIARDEADWEVACSGRGEAFGVIFDRHRARVLRHSLGLVSTGGDAEDVVAVVFFEAWRKRTAIRFVNGSMLPWLLVTATNAANNVSRSTRRYEQLLRRLPPPVPVEDHAVIDDDRAIDALHLLTLRDQQVITICVLEGLSEKEASSVLAIPPGTVKSRLSRAKARLAALLNESSAPATLTKEATDVG